MKKSNERKSVFQHFCQNFCECGVNKDGRYQRWEEFSAESTGRSIFLVLFRERMSLKNIFNIN